MTFPLTSRWPGSDLGGAGHAGLKPELILSTVLIHWCEDVHLNCLETIQEAARKLLLGSSGFIFPCSQLRVGT